MRAAGKVHARQLSDRVGRLQEALLLELDRVEVVLNRGRRGQRAGAVGRGRRTDNADVPGSRGRRAQERRANGRGRTGRRDDVVDAGRRASLVVLSTNVGPPYRTTEAPGTLRPLSCVTTVPTIVVVEAWALAASGDSVEAALKSSKVTRARIVCEGRAAARGKKAPRSK
jgi:hypothetical protein